MKNPCGLTRARIYQQIDVNGIPVFLGTGVNPVNSPAQFFVAWGKESIHQGLIRTFNSETLETGYLWFVDEDEAEAKFLKIQQVLGEL